MAEPLTKEVFDGAIKVISESLLNIKEHVGKIESKIDKIESQNFALADRITRIEERAKTGEEKIKEVTGQIEILHEKIRKQKTKCDDDITCSISTANVRQEYRIVLYLLGAVILAVGGVSGLLKLIIFK
jgi:chromosome segregation ATPase